MLLNFLPRKQRTKSIGITCERRLYMTRDEVIQLFKFLKNIYPNFEVTSEKVDIWAKMMQKMDFKRVMARAEQHATESPFPPTIAEIAAYAPEKNVHLEQIRQWEKEAAQVPQHVKDKFKQQLENLLKDKANGF